MGAKCEKCGEGVSEKVEKYSKDYFDGHVYCYKCQQKNRAPESSWSYDKTKKEESENSTLNIAGSMPSKTEKSEDEELEAFHKEVASEVEAEDNELYVKVVELVTAMSMNDKETYYAWLKVEYDVDDIETISLQEKRRVLDEVQRLTALRGAVKNSEKVVDAEIVEDAGEVEPKVATNESEWNETVEIDEGEFSFKEGDDGVLLCKNGANDNEYTLDIERPHCSCMDFIVNKKEKEWCKHLKAAAVKYPVKELPKVPAEIENALAKPEKEKLRRTKPKKEEVMALTIMDQQVELAVQVPTELILSEEKAVETIKAIVGDKPKKEDVIMSYAGIEELNASVVTSLAQYIGIRYVPIMIEEEKQKMNMGEIYLAGASRDQKLKYEAVAKLMGEVDITTRCKITTLSGWRDKGGNVRIGIGTKEEILLPHDLLDISRRGAAYIRTKCETKSAKKSIINALPVTAEGILRKVKSVYGWG